jgi:hypothetical protein
MTEQKHSAGPKGVFDRLPLARAEAPKVNLEGEALLLPGDRMPNFILPDPAGNLLNFYQTLTGQPMVLLLPANTARQDQWDEIKGFAAAMPDLVAAGLGLAIVSNDGIESLAMVSTTIPAPAAWFADVNGLVNARLRSAAKFDLAGVICVLLDGDQRVIAIRGHEPGHAAWALETFRARRAMESASLSAVAPVLLLPVVLDPATCRQLVEQLADAAGQASIGDPALADRAMRLILRRVGPEVDKAFSFDDFTVEPLRLRGDEASAEAAPERERLRLEPDGTGRGFVLLLDLAAEGYEGGEIAFPEYGPHRYRPGTGGVVVYSDTLLRELRPVITGRRVLLTTVLRRAATPRPQVQ